jgi:hypothetical protein
MGGLCFASLIWLRPSGGFCSQFSRSLSNPAFRVGATTLTAVRVMAFLGRRSAACSLVGGTRETQDTDSVSQCPPWLVFGIRELLWLNFTSEQAGGLRVNRPHLPSSTLLQIPFRLRHLIAYFAISVYYILDNIFSVLLYCTVWYEFNCLACRELRHRSNSTMSI